LTTPLLRTAAQTTANTSPVIDLLLWSVRARPDAAPLLGEQPRSWDALVDAADFHSLLPLLFWQIGRGPARSVPEGTAGRMQKAYLDSAKRSLFLAANLAELTSQFDAAQIPTIALKGPALADSLYGDPALRPSCDLDLLIRRQDLPAAVELLASLGYRRAPHLIRLSLRKLARLDCHLVVQPKLGAPIELHWAVAPDDYPFHIASDVLWRSRQVTQIAGRKVGVLAPECLLLYLCLHGAKHAWSRLHWLGDLARLIDRGIDFPRAQALATETKCDRLFSLGLLLVHNVLDTNVPREILDMARADQVVLMTARETERRLKRVPPVEPSSTARTAYNARLALRMSAKVRHWFAMFKAPKEGDLERITLPRQLFFLYYVLRVQRLAVKYGRKLVRLKPDTTCHQAPPDTPDLPDLPDPSDPPDAKLPP
jgi:putative nucleotidyltransferase-like protein